MNLNKTLGYSTLFLWLFLMISGLWIQIQMLLFSQKVLVSPRIYQLVFLLITLSILYLQRKTISIKNKSVFWIWILFGVYIAINALLLIGFDDSNLTLIKTYVTYYAFLILVGLFVLMKPILNEKIIVTTILIIFVPLSVLAIFQFILNEPIVPTATIDGKFHFAQNRHFFHHIRAFSIFRSIAYFGHFIALVAGFVTSLFVLKKGTRFKLLYGTFLILVIITGCVTIKRVTYMEIVAAIASCIIMYLLIFKLNSKYKRFLNLLPLFYLGIGVIGVFLVYFLNYLGGSKLFSTYSIDVRLENWNHYLGLWTDDIFTFLFGSGVIQNVDKGIVIDNMFLMIGYHIGIIGLIIWTLLMWMLWNYIIKQAQTCPSPLSMGIASFWSAWIVVGMFTSTQSGAYVLPFVLICIGLIKNKKNNETKSMHS